MTFLCGAIMKNILILFISLTLFGCGKSEIDKCVEAKLRWDAEKYCGFNKSECLNNDDKNRILSDIRISHEGDYRLECLRAAAGK